MKAFYALILVLLAGTTYGQMFSDNEARKAILELKGKMRNLELTIKNSKKIDDLEFIEKYEIYKSKNSNLFPIDHIFFNLDSDFFILYDINNVDLNSGDKDARKAIVDLRIAVVILEKILKVNPQKYTSTGFETIKIDNELRKVIIDSRLFISSLYNEIYKKYKNNNADNSGELALSAETLRQSTEQRENRVRLEAQQVAEERRRLDAQKAQIEQEKKASRIAIKGSASQPDANGDFTITIQTGADTASLKIDGEEVGGKRDGNYVIKRVARVGEQNSYSITARDVFGNTDSVTITVARQVADSRPVIPRLNPANVKVQQSRDAVAIIIGIENYRRVAKADFANADAKEFYTYASRALGIKPENIKLLVDDGADDIEMLNAFQNWLPLKVNKGKTDVYVFYSGHGYPSQDGSSLYFLPFNVDKQYLDRTSVKQKEVVAALQKVQAKSVTMFIDACYSGQTRGGEVLIAGLKPIALKTDEKAYPADFTVITASAADQFSSASQDLKHGIFSFYLMKGMEGDADLSKDGKITSGELQQYLSEMVGRQAMGLNRTQNTQLFGDPARVLVGR